MPSENAIATEFHVARNTARRALHLLVDEGLIAPVRSKGYQVLDSPARRQDRRSLVETIAGELRQQIESGQLGPQKRLPSERQLGEHYSASRDVIRAALDILKAEGLIFGVQGWGRFVREGR